MKTKTFKLSFLVTALFAITQWLADAAIGPNLWLKFDETTGTTAADSSGNSNNAIFNADPIWGAGQAGNAVTFDGATLFADIPNSPSLDISGTNITIAGWINTVAGGDTVLIDKPYNADDVANGTFVSPFYQYGIERNGGNLLFTFADSDTTVQSVSSSKTIGLNEIGFIQDNTWQHFAVTYDGTSVKWYVNGVQQNSVPTTGSLQARGNRLRIGGDDASQQFYDGQLDDLRIYDRTLNIADIRALAGDTNQTPDVTIIQPVERTTFLAGANITLTADAVAATGRTIAKVEFFQGSTFLGTDTSSPYSFTWTNVAGGSYSLTAKATDSAGIATNSIAVNIKVNGGSGSTTVNLFPTEDTFLNLDTSTNVSSGTLNLYTWPDNKIANVILMKFDLSSIPAGATITDAQLNLYLVESDTHVDAGDATYTVGAYKPTINPNLALATGYTYDGTNPWTANSCCNNDIPMAQGDITAAYTALEVDKTNGFEAWNLKPMVQEWLNTPATNYGVLLNSDATRPRDRFRAFASMEDITASKRPYLQVTYTSASTTVNLFPTEDTFLNLDTSTNVSSATLNLYTWPDNKIANVILMKFDLSSIPAGAAISDAQLNLYLVESDTHVDAGDATYIVGAYKPTINPNLVLATGFTYDGTNPWTPNSCCNNDIPMAQGDISAVYATLEVDKTNGFKAWNLKTMVQEWLNTPATNYGVLLNSDATRPRDRFRAFASMEDITASKRPYLQVAYTSGSTGSSPSLAVARSGNNLVISWPAAAVGFGLESTASLSPANWSPVTTPPVVVGNQVTVTVGMSGSATFYRLKK